MSESDKALYDDDDAPALALKATDLENTFQSAEKHYSSTNAPDLEAGMC